MPSLPSRPQRTIAGPAEVEGRGLFSGIPVCLRFEPAAVDTGIVFRRADLPGAPTVPATIDHVVERPRRTAVGLGSAVVETIEHVMAALAGLHVDNCLIEIDAPETPGCDGSAQAFVDVLQQCGIIAQDALRRTIVITDEMRICGDDGSEIIARPASAATMTAGYELDYGTLSPVRPHKVACEVTPETFARDIAFARTFVLESEIAALRAQGYGQHLTPRELLVFDDDGSVRENALRADDECARHKLLDCIGDWALIGCDLAGDFRAIRSGHRLNRELVRRIRDASADFVKDTRIAA